MKILVAEDNIAFRRLLESQLKQWGYEVVLAADGQQAWKILSGRGAPRLAILDWMMPALSGVDLCRKIRRELKEPYIYVILLTALHGEDELVTGLDAGADEYVTKPFRPTELRARLRAGRRILELQRDLLAARDALKDEAARDLLTGLWNHAEILHRLDAELFRAERQKIALSVMLADIDYFKAVNDTHGHMAGDAVLRMAAQRMAALIRPYDALGRYGGEEFLFVLPACDPPAALALAERVRLAIGTEGLDTSEGVINVTISLGVAVRSAEQIIAVADLVKAADDALYQAKHSGRNRVCVAP